ncbi:MAG TPA: TlpA disulfide reductase family protein [Pyrinomonadaceae bacterium]|jgi:thiol-disulfide isomerase/thioredoxin|nr:TlpA disulfide reductase family protein [Pyrinomonadaceae bacterium]
MKKLTIALVLLFFVPVMAFAQDAEQFTGKFDVQLQPDMFHFYERAFAPLSDGLKFKFSEKPAKGSVLTAGNINNETAANGKSKMVLVEPPDGMPFLAYDINVNGIIEANEQFVFAPSREERNALDVSVNIPVKNSLFKTFPIFIRYYRGFKHPQFPAENRLLQQSVWAFAMGHVSIRGQNILFQYPFEAAAGTTSTTEGLFGVDVNGDGKIRNEQFSPETSSANKSELVFRLGDLYISTAKLDLERNEIVVRKREKAEYLRHEIELAKEMPDFQFVDLEGKKQSLAGFRGKYLFIDFWGVWCGDCIRETPFQVEAYKRFRSRGLEILGLDWDDDIEKVKGYMKKANVTWAQARKESILTLVTDTYRIQEFPSSILLGPDGKVLVLDQQQLQGARLLETLDRILPK